MRTYKKGDGNRLYPYLKPYRRVTTTLAMRVPEPFLCETIHGPVTCDGGYVAFDNKGYPYPVDEEIFKRTYREVK